MVEIRQYIWVFPVVAGVLAIVSLITPAVSMNVVGMLAANLWFWDLYTYSYSGVFSGTEFITEPTVMATNFIITGILATVGILLLAIGVRSKDELDLRKIKTPLIAFGVLFIISEILWLIIVPMFFPMVYYWDSVLGMGGTYTFWKWDLGMGMTYNLHTVGFGIIGGFLGAGVAFGGAGAAHYYSKERELKIPEKKEITSPVEKAPPSEKAKFEFCPECGAKIEEDEIKFCGKCGFEFKTP
jgi:hypothetical protein